MTVVNPVKYSRRTFDVEGVQVTDSNMNAVALWSKGTVRSTEELKGWDKSNPLTFIQLEVCRAQHRRQTMAFPGEWVLMSGGKFKVYSNKSFQSLFIPSVDELERTKQVLGLVKEAMINQAMINQAEVCGDKVMTKVAASISARIVGLFKF